MGHHFWIKQCIEVGNGLLVMKRKRCRSSSSVRFILLCSEARPCLSQCLSLHPGLYMVSVKCQGDQTTFWSTSVSEHPRTWPNLLSVECSRVRGEVVEQLPIYWPCSQIFVEGWVTYVLASNPGRVVILLVASSYVRVLFLFFSFS